MELNRIRIGRMSGRKGSRGVAVVERLRKGDLRADVGKHKDIEKRRMKPEWTTQGGRENQGNRREKQKQSVAFEYAVVAR